VSESVFDIEGPFRPYRRLFEAFEGEGHELLFVGGCVRDRVMKRGHSGDIDLATSATPSETKAVLKKHRYKAIPLGEKFGTITTLVDRQTVEITTYRVGELYEPGSRHPVVQFGTDITADLARRDLSINAMAMRADGTIIDPYDGQTAIANRCLEVPGGGYENTISILRDDPLRLLRTARFAARFDYAPTAETTRAALVSAPSLADISRERWAAEFDKLLVSEHPGVGLQWLFDVGAWPVLFPGANASDQACVALIAALMAAPMDRDVRWALLVWHVLSGAEGPAITTDPAVMWPTREERHDAALQQCGRFRLSNARRARMGSLITLPFDESALRSSATTPQLRRWYTDADGHVFAQLDFAHALAHGEPGLAQHIEAKRVALAELAERENPVPSLPTGLGGALRQALSLKGPEIGEAMRRVREAILDGEIPNEADVPTYVAWASAPNDDRGNT
jgi:tRNA nucleotidyltransferase/poly(A) polymerase